METAKRGRKAIQFNVQEFQDTILCLEQEEGGAFANRSQLWAAVAATEWASTLSPRPMTSQVAMLKAETFDLKVNTPKGKKGRVAGSAGKVSDDGTAVLPVRRSRTIDEASITVLRGVTATVNQKAVDRVSKGSLKAAIKLKCIDCCCGQKKEVAMCRSKDCSLWNFRPYKKIQDVLGVREAKKRGLISLPTV